MPRTALVLVPGILCDATVWRPQATALADVADPILIEHELHDSLGGMAEAILAGAPQHFALAGHSMGGRVALEIMRRAPQRVTHLALLSTGYEALAPGRAGDMEASGRYRLLSKAYGEGMRTMAEDWSRNMVHSDRLQDRPLMDAILDMIASKTPRFYEGQIRALLSRPDAADVLQAVRCPTLVLCGAQDSWSPVSRHRDIAAMIPASTLVEVPDSGHMVTMERPDAVNAAMRAWLTRGAVPDTSAARG